MIEGIPCAARIAVLLSPFCAVGLAFQPSSDGPIQVIPRGLSKAPSATATVLRVNSSLVLIPVHGTTAGGASVTGLKKEDFVLFEDGVRQTITHFAQGDAPVSAGLLLDTSGSMKNKMAKASEAATEFFKFANPGGILWTLPSARAAGSISLILVIVAIPPKGKWDGFWLTGIAAGALDTIGILFFLRATQIGRLDVAALVCSLYPAGTILLAALVLREWPSRRKFAGIALALAAIALLSV